MRLLPLLVLLSIALVACGDGTSEPLGSVSQAADPTENSVSAASALATFTNLGGKAIDLDVEIAATPEERSRGLMLRESLDENAGMLFLYEDDHQSGFWMKDTLIPLSIAFLLQDGTIIDIQDMEPQTTDLHRPSERYRNAVEVNQGWFGRNRIAVGDVVELPDGLRQ